MEFDSLQSAGKTLGAGLVKKGVYEHLQLTIKPKFSETVTPKLEISVCNAEFTNTLVLENLSGADMKVLADYFDALSSLWAENCEEVNEYFKNKVLEQ